MTEAGRSGVLKTPSEGVLVGEGVRGEADRRARAIRSARVGEVSVARARLGEEAGSEGKPGGSDGLGERSRRLPRAVEDGEELCLCIAVPADPDLEISAGTLLPDIFVSKTLNRSSQTDSVTCNLPFQPCSTSSSLFSHSFSRSAAFSRKAITSLSSRDTSSRSKVMSEVRVSSRLAERVDSRFSIFDVRVVTRRRRESLVDVRGGKVGRGGFGRPGCQLCESLR